MAFYYGDAASAPLLFSGAFRGGAAVGCLLVAIIFYRRLLLDLGVARFIGGRVVCRSMGMGECVEDEIRPPPMAVGVKQTRLMHLCVRRPESRASDFAQVTGFIARLSPRRQRPACVWLRVFPLKPNIA